MRRAALRRPRLNRWLSDALDRPLTVICGPAGYGKSTLAADWVGELDLPHAWLTLDRSHRDPRVLVRDLAGAVRVTFPHAIRHFAHRVASPHGESDGRTLAGELCAAVELSIDERFVFVIDDVHVLVGSPAADALDALIHFAPANVRLLLLTRAWDAVPEAARRVSDGDAAALLQSDLAFDDAEAARMLRRARLRDADEIRAITRRADGWPAALALLAAHRAHDPDAVTDPTAAFVLADFLDREVLARLTPAQLAMIEVCAVLEVFEAEVLPEISGVRRGGAILRKLELHTQLITRAGDATYRIHGLLAEHLVARLRRDAPARLRTLRRAAHAAYAQRGDLRRATEFALDAPDWPAAAALIDGLREELYQHGEWTTLAAWIDRLPAPVMRTHVDLALLRARVDMKLGNPDSGLLRLNRLRADLLDDHQRVRRSIYRSVALRQLGRAVEAVQSCLSVRTAAPALERLKGELHLEHGIALGMCGRFRLARRHLTAALAEFEQLGNQHRVAEVLDALGVTETLSGRLDMAMRFLMRARAVSHQLGDVDLECQTLTNIGNIQRLTGNLNAARDTFDSLLERVRRHSLRRFSYTAIVNVAEIEHDLGNLHRAELLMNDAMRGTHGTATAHSTFDVQYVLVMTYLEQRRLADAERLCAEAIAMTSRGGYGLDRTRFVGALGALRIAEGRTSDAIALLDEALESARRLDAPAECGKIQFRRAHAFLIEERIDECRICLQDVGRIIGAVGYDEFLWADVRIAWPTLSYASSHEVRELFAPFDPARRTSSYRDAPRGVIPRFHVMALGPLRVRSANGDQVTWRSERSAEMLLYLLCHGGAATKEEIGAALWPEIAPEHLNSAFHSTLFRLRAVVGRERIPHSDGRYGLAHPSDFRYDVDEFRILTARARALAPDDPNRLRQMREAAALCRGRFAAQCESEWVEEIRRALAREHLSLLTELGRAALLGSDWESAFQVAAEIARVDPHEEAAVRLEFAARRGAEGEVAREFANRSSNSGLSSPIGRRADHASETGRLPIDTDTDQLQRD